ncbi:MAG: YtxH domain-containing protein [Tannerellaceae bacterium]|jgi:gas vesicle protein|nr:YtxH domain-containing protein [Tannerellaceae bacterium]
MKSVDSKLLLGLIIGAAVGAAIGYLAGTDKKEELLEGLNKLAGKVKDSVCTAIDKYKECGCEAEETPEAE